MTEGVQWPKVYNHRRCTMSKVLIRPKSGSQSLHRKHLLSCFKEFERGEKKFTKWPAPSEILTFTLVNGAILAT